MFQTQQGVEEAKNYMYMDCLFVCFAGGSSSCNNFASVGRRLSAWRMNASWCLPQDNIHLGFALPPPCHHHNLCFRQRKLPDSLQKKWLILIGYPETGKWGEFFANMTRSYRKIIIQILHFVHAFIVAWVDLLCEMLQHYGWPNCTAISLKC